MSSSSCENERISESMLLRGESWARDVHSSGVWGEVEARPVTRDTIQGIKKIPDRNFFIFPTTLCVSSTILPDGLEKGEEMQQREVQVTLVEFWGRTCLLIAI